MGCQEVSRVVSPFALEEAVGGRQQLESVHPKIAQVRKTRRHNRQAFEIRASHSFVYQRRTSRNVPTPRSF